VANPGGDIEELAKLGSGASPIVISPTAEPGSTVYQPQAMRTEIATLSWAAWVDRDGLEVLRLFGGHVLPGRVSFIHVGVRINNSCDVNQWSLLNVGGAPDSAWPV
jgi:hypothetical protein